MLTADSLEDILTRIPRLTVGVLGDLFLDRYLDLDAALTEASLETGLDAYQVVRVRPQPGAAGTVLNNLVALGVGRVCPVAVIGDDGEGYELTRCLGELGRVEGRWLLADRRRRTPTYTKPMLHGSDGSSRELNRLDIKNRTPLPADLEERLLEALDEVRPAVDALLVLDQVSEADCGVVTAAVRRRLAELADADPDTIVLADSRERIGQFRSVALKPNRRECLRAVYGGDEDRFPVESAAAELSRRAGRPVFCTLGERGIWVARGPHGSLVPAYPVRGPLDVVGAGDSTSAAIACALAARRSPEEAAAFGNLVASITIRQLGTTGTATPAQVRARWREVTSG
jgi:rfaE bifunctional protein kinase chain/domain